MTRSVNEGEKHCPFYEKFSELHGRKANDNEIIFMYAWNIVRQMKIRKINFHANVMYIFTYILQRYMENI